MTKQEFEKRLGKTVNDRDYAKIERCAELEVSLVLAASCVKVQSLLDCRCVVLYFHLSRGKTL